jgi:prephenate dehydrogenase
VRVVGFDKDEKTVQAAHKSGFNARNFERGQLLDYDAIILATPVRTTIEFLSMINSRAHSLAMDVGSTKREVVGAAQNTALAPSFVGAHPMMGTHESGWAGARTGMFKDALVFLCPGERTSPPALQTASSFWSDLGARTIQQTPEDHDAFVAWTSHLPQLAASALALAMNAGDIKRGDLGPGGRDMTRLSGSNAEMWVDIVMTNRDMLSEPLDGMIDALASLREAVRSGSEEAVRELLRSSADWYKK